jgi:hypothetical protein
MLIRHYLRVAVLIAFLLLLFILVLAAAFLFTDFYSTQGRLDISSQVSAYSSSSIQKGTNLALNEPLDVYVLGSGLLQQELSERMPDYLKMNPYVGSITMHSGPPVASTNCVLVIDLRSKDILWTPFYARTTANIRMAFASDGAVDWIDQDVVRFESGQIAVRVRGIYDVNARNYGIFSIPGYYEYLGQSISKQLNDSLSAQLDNAQPKP